MEVVEIKSEVTELRVRVDRVVVLVVDIGLDATCESRGRPTQVA